jgi:hypothetical protein
MLFKKNKKPRKKVNYSATLQSVKKQLVVKCIAACLRQGISINFFSTKSQTAIGVNFYKDGDREVYYADNRQALEEILYMVLDEEDMPEDEIPY